MKEIPLTKGQIAIVDDEDYERVIGIGKWQAVQNVTTKQYYAIHSTRKKSSFVTMHRFIMNTPKNMVCDHINHNTLDNRKINLRNCTDSENKWNLKVSPKNKLGIKNIWPTQYNTFIVRIKKHGKLVFSKTYKTLEEAKKSRDEQLKIHHGEYANLL